MKIRGLLALGIVSLGLLLSDLVQRAVIAPWVKLRPSSRVVVLGRWINLMAALVTRTLGTVGGARIQLPPRSVPSGPGTLILMNHQSVLDIPLVVSSVADGYPLIVTRARYQRFIPLISHMVRLYQYPVVDPTANPKDVLRSVRAMARAGKESDIPFALFPEGTRSRDGEIGEFKTRGLAKLLQQRPWTVHVFVVDGYWQHARFKDFVSDMTRIEGRIAQLETLEWTDPQQDPTDFINEIRSLMVEGLDALRARDGEA